MQTYTINQEIEACLKFIKWQGFNLRHKYEALKRLGNFSATLSLNADQWAKLANRSLQNRLLPAQSNIDNDLTWLKHPNNHFITIFDERYPNALKRLVDPPLGLYVQGDCSVLNSPQLAIVGSRRQTPTGKKIASQFAYDLSALGITITSGLALGIDASAHSAVCEVRGTTVAVLGSGLDTIYPRQNKQLASMVQANGCLVSEFPIGTPPRKENFPARNRVIAGLSMGVLVIEAAKRSGSLITARLALEQGKEVFAVPGSILSPQSSGCNYLIKQGAVLAQNLDDVLFELQLPLTNIKPNLEEQQIESMTTCKHQNCQVLKSIDFESTSIDRLIQRTELEFQVLSKRLLELELEGLIERAHNGDYFRLT